MASYLSPVCNTQNSDSNGDPLNGGKVYTYAAGTSTPIATYTDSDGATPQANPIILNAAGRPTSPIWLPAGQAVKLVLKTSAEVAVDEWDDVEGINDPAYGSNLSEWTTYTGAVTYVSATSFSLAGDQTGTLHVNRRIKSTNTGGTIYSTVTASSYNAGTGRTTITVANDSGALDAGLSAVAYGLLSYINPSMPGFVASKTANGYQKLPSGLLLQWGTVTTNGAGIGAVVFPTTFPTGVLQVAATANSTGPGNNLITGYNSSTLGVAGVTLYAATNAGVAASELLSWTAIGY